jgi:SNF2 family DNA or RNA helicase
MDESRERDAAGSPSAVQAEPEHHPRRAPLVLHANWSDSRLWFWGESADLWSRVAPPDQTGDTDLDDDDAASAAFSPPSAPAPPGPPPAALAHPELHARPSADGSLHPFAATHASLREVLEPAGVPSAQGDPELRLPAAAGLPVPSTRLLHLVGHMADLSVGSALAAVRVPALAVDPPDVLRALDELESWRDEGTAPYGVALGSSIDFWIAAARLARHLLAQERFVPGLRQDLSGDLRGLWQPWVSDARTAERVALLLSAMPPIARAAADDLNHQPWPILESFLASIVDAQCRQALIREDMEDSVREKDPAADAQVAWLRGLLGPRDEVPARGSARTEMIKQIRRWISGLEDRGVSSAWRLCLKLSEPLDAAVLGDMEDPGENIAWPLTFHLQSQENPRILVDASDIWMLPGDALTIEGKRLEGPQELLLAELGRASRLFPLLERALHESEPADLPLNTRQAYQFLRELRPILLEQGFGVIAPEWWDQPTARLGARLKLTSDSLEMILGQQGPGVTPTTTRMGLAALVGYTWDIAIGGATLSLAEFEKLASKRTPLVRINGRWVEIRPDDVKAAIKFIQENPGGTMEVGDAIRLAYGSDARLTGIPIVGLEATGWVSMFFGDAAENQTIPIIEPPPGFHGSLRPYQIRGVSWMAFLERFGFGPCLADDMGLGKTIQLLALMAFERNGCSSTAAPADAPGTPPPAAAPASPAPAPGGGLGATPGTTQNGQGWSRLSAEVLADAAAASAASGRVLPTLLVVPMSVVGNWIHEARRFCPEMKLLLHHGMERLQGDAFLQAAADSDAVITTYALAHRDRDLLQRMTWQRVVLDEAQYVKNPTTKQSQAVRGLNSNSRVALTGTPVENRLSELWSILDFLNPGYLGPAATFRKRFSVPIERYRDAGRLSQLRALVKPFILRRLKTDPGVAADLPEKLEMREYSPLTTEQAELYETVVNRMLGEVEAAEGMQRRGLVLSTLIKLKQICNHPSQYLRDHAADSAEPPQIYRSGKCVRLVELLEQALDNGDQALIFTQFRQMGALLASMLRHRLEREVLFFHGGTPQAARVQMVDRFQNDGAAAPILIVSLKAGGVGLNLTAATHVFHFDRWWNPAVENQATDRAHRIGQFRTVQVHKFVVRGTLEERIDEMIEQKTELAENIIGSGEAWLTELSTDQLRDMLTLRRDAVGDEYE